MASQPHCGEDSQHCGLDKALSRKKSEMVEVTFIEQGTDTWCWVCMVLKGYVLLSYLGTCGCENWTNKNKIQYSVQ